MDEFKRHENLITLDRSAVISLIDKIIIHKDKCVDIVYRWQDEFAWQLDISQPRGKGGGLNGKNKAQNNPLQPEAAASAPTERVYRTAGYARLSIETATAPAPIRWTGRRSSSPNTLKATLPFPSVVCGRITDTPAWILSVRKWKRSWKRSSAAKSTASYARIYPASGATIRKPATIWSAFSPFLGVRFIAINDNFDTLTAERSADGYISVLLNIVNEMYSKDLSAKLGATFAMKQKNGDYIGAAPPYGAIASAPIILTVWSLTPKQRAGCAAYFCHEEIRHQQSDHRPDAQRRGRDCSRQAALHEDGGARINALKTCFGSISAFTICYATRFISVMWRRGGQSNHSTGTSQSAIKGVRIG